MPRDTTINYHPRVVTQANALLKLKYELGQRLLKDHYKFTKYFFEHRENEEFHTGPHHMLMGETLDRVYSGEITRLLVNVPPGYTKTEMSVVAFIAHGFAINPKSRFIHATYSDPLARENSDKARDTCKTVDYMEMYQNVYIHRKSDAKDRWKTEQGGGVLAKAAGGPITGFRAGYMDRDKFTGALIIDDPIKPDDAFSKVHRDRINNRVANTFRSRLAHDDVPIIVIMQRVHEDDMSGFLLRGDGNGEFWHHLFLPVVTDRSRPYPKRYTHGIEIEHDLPEGPLWPGKHTQDEVKVLQADAYTYSSQYDQNPQAQGGALFKSDYWRWYRNDDIPRLEYRVIYGDTAQKTKEHNDFSVLQCWGKVLGEQRIYLIDSVRGRWEAPELEQVALAFWQKHNNRQEFDHRQFGALRSIKVEDKVSGTGLIQYLRKRSIPIEGIERHRDKYTRGLDTVPQVAVGNVWLPADKPWVDDLIYELDVFTGLDDAHDDQVDPLMDAVSDMIGAGASIYDNL